MTPRFVTLGLILALVSPALAQSPMPTPSPSPQPSAVPTPSVPGLIVPLWPEGKMPGHGSSKPEIRNTPAAGGLIKVTEVSEPTIEVFKAPGAKGPVPAMIVSPGGGYGLLAYNFEGTEIAAWLNSLGITGIVLKYRVPNNREGAFQDIQRAMRLTRLHAAEWGIQPDKLGVIGFSAGGHLSARLCTNFEKAAYPAIDEADQLGCRPDFAILAYSGYLGDDGKLAPEMTISASTPPTFLLVTEDDHHLLGSKVYDEALKAAKVTEELRIYPTGGHGYGLHSQKDVKVWPIDAAEWLRKTGIQ